MDFAELAQDIAHEAEQALFLTGQIKQIDERIANLYADADPAGIVASAPGVGPTISAVIAGRLGGANRFTSLAAIRAPTPDWCPRSASPGCRRSNRTSPRPATRCCARCSTQPPTVPARSIPNSGRSTSASWPATATTPRRSVTGHAGASRPACAKHYVLCRLVTKDVRSMLNPPRETTCPIRRRRRATREPYASGGTCLTGERAEGRAAHGLLRGVSQRRDNVRHKRQTSPSGARPLTSS